MVGANCEGISRAIRIGSWGCGHMVVNPIVMEMNIRFAISQAPKILQNHRQFSHIRISAEIRAPAWSSSSSLVPDDGSDGGQ